MTYSLKKIGFITNIEIIRAKFPLIMLRPILRNNSRNIIRHTIRSYSSRTPVYIKSYTFYSGFGFTLLAFPLVYGAISNDDESKSSSKLIELTEHRKDETEQNVKDSKGDITDEENEPTAEDYEGAAYNPVTGEINWDCPCLGGMAHGPCGEEFKEAFACFVYSESEPKGIDCIKKFEAMRTCFRQYPEHYKEQLMDEEELDAAQSHEQENVSLSTDTSNAVETPAKS